MIEKIEIKIVPLNENEKNQLFLTAVKDKLEEVALTVEPSFSKHFGTQKRRFKKYWAIFAKKVSLGGLFVNDKGVPLADMILKKKVSAEKGVSVLNREKSKISKGFMAGNLPYHFVTRNKKTGFWLLAKYAPKQKRQKPNLDWHPRTEESPYEFFRKNLKI